MNLPKHYITTLQKGGSINGFEVIDGRMQARTEEEVVKMESSPAFISKQIIEYVSIEAVAEKSFLDETFSADEQSKLKELLTPAEIKDALNLLIAGKKEKTPDEKKKDEVTIETFTATELKTMLADLKVEFAGNANKTVLFGLYQEALAKQEKI